MQVDVVQPQVKVTPCSHGQSDGLFRNTWSQHGPALQALRWMPELWPLGKIPEKWKQARLSPAITVGITIMGQSITIIGQSLGKQLAMDQTKGL